MLTGVLGRRVELLEPGGRSAVNVANLGRKPYRSLSADVIGILARDLGLLLRGELIWQKAKAAAGNCAWGTYQKPGDPVLRDLTERVIVASKGRLDRAIPPAKRAAAGYPSDATIFRDEFLEATLDVWELRPESASRIGHPAPFPVELPQRLIELYTFRGDVVLDPFLGSGSTAVAAARTGRRYVGYDTEAEYVALASERVAAEVGVAGQLFAAPVERALPADRKAAAVLAVEVLAAAGFEVVQQDRRVPGAGVTVDVVARGDGGQPWYFDVTGAFTTTPAGLSRADVLWKAVGRASVLQACGVGPVVLVSSDLPARRSAGDAALHALGPRRVHDVVGLLDAAGHERLARYAAGGRQGRPLPGFWTLGEIGP
jgi:site-specific DNA-methyltransferase (adenine-specific)